jgi:hypothetical protein
MKSAMTNSALVIGCYRDASVVEASVRYARKNCGPDVPILLHDDTHGEHRKRCESRLRSVAGQFGCEYYHTPQALGHAGGDMSAFSHGLRFAHRFGCDFLVKLSQRFLIDVPNWINTARSTMRRLMLPTLGCSCKYRGRTIFHYRTEAVGLSVSDWLEQAETTFEPRCLDGECFEIMFANLLRRRYGGIVAFWPLVGDDRTVSQPGTLWRESTTFGEEDHAGEATIKDRYRQWLTRVGVEPEADFSPLGWQQRLDNYKA